jgi:hypothetical protein
MPEGPMLLISKSVRTLLPYWHGPLGQLFTPRVCWPAWTSPRAAGSGGGRQ